MKNIGTRLRERLARGDKGINSLDELCKTHDIAYEKHKDSSKRYEADKELAKGALKRVFAKDSSLGERAASLFVTTAMKAKNGLSKFGMGIPNLSKRKRTWKRKQKRSKQISFATLVKDAKHGMDKAKPTSIGIALKAAFRSAKRSRKGKKVKVPRIIKVPKITGGILPIVPILAGLSAIGSLVGSTAGVIKTIKDIKNASESLAENKRHNMVMEQKLGSGLYLRTMKKGGGLYLSPYRKTVGSGLYLKSFQGSKNYH